MLYQGEIEVTNRLLARLRLTVAVTTLAAGVPGLAQDAAAADDEIIVTAQRGNQSQVTLGGSVGVLGDKPAEDVPFTIKSYNAALILNQQPQTLGQLLENDPSVRTTYGFGNAAEQFVIRGFVLAGDDVAYDGLYGVAPRQIVAPELYDSVQVLNGASAFLNGAAPGGSGLGGSVNLIPKRAGADDLQRLTLNYTSGAHIGGAFDVARRFGDAGQTGLRLNGAARRGDVSIDDEFRSTYVIGGALDHQAGDLRLSLDLAYQRVKVRQLRHKVTLGAGLTSVPRVPDAEHNFAQPFTFTTLRDVFGMLKAEYDIADNVLAYASIGARDGSEDGIYGGLTVNNALTGAATGSALFVPRTDNNEAANAGVRIKLAAGGITHEFNIGASGMRQINRNAYDFLGGFAGFATNLYATADVALPGTGFVGGDLNDPNPVSRTRLWSSFASDTIGFWDDRILATVGLRLQKVNSKGYDYFTTLQTSEYDESAVTPVFGLVVKPVDGVSLFANRIEGLSQGPTAPNDPAITNPGEVFPPTKSKQYELGGKFALGALNLGVAAFQTEQPSGYAVGGVFGLFGEQRNRGIELNVEGELVEGLRLIAGGSVNDAELRDTGIAAIDGNKAPGVPDYLINANVEWDVLPALTLTGRVVRTGEQWIDRANTLELSGWTRFDLGARYVALVGDKPVTLRANVDNVANKRYWASAFDIFSPQLLQGAPRTFKLSASVDF